MLVLSFVVSDFSNETVFNNSHTTKPIFYKIAGTWGNHEGSLLLWLLVLTLFILIFLVKTKNQPIKYRILTLVFQQIIIVGFFVFLIKTSNPFNHIYPIPTEGLGLNPILQDPAASSNSSTYFIFRICRIIYNFFLSFSCHKFKSISKKWASHIKNGC